MTTAQITGGTVEFTRPSNYQTDKPGAKVVLSFACADGCPDDVARAVLDRVSAMAMAKAGEMVGDKPAPEVVEQPKPRGRPRAIPAEVPPFAPHENFPTPEQRDILDKAIAAADPAAITVDDTPPAPVEQPEIVITDKDLQMAANEAVAQKAPSKAIVALIEEFTNPPGTSPGERIPGKRMTTIEPARRAEYLARLKALYANA